MQKVSLVFILCFTTPIAHAQPKATSLATLKRLRFNPEKIYIVARGTQSKGGLLAQSFNRMDKQITHVGIGFYTGKAFRIYNVSDVRSPSGSALTVDSIDSFTAGNEMRYLSIWECDNDPEELAMAKKICNDFQKKQITFDPSFRISRDDTLYCSEFCSEVFRKIDAAKFQFQPRTITLSNALYQRVLRTKTLTYFPVDFFQGNNAIKKVAEWQR
jgi:hypothetical protein